MKKILLKTILVIYVAQFLWLSFSFLMPSQAHASIMHNNRLDFEDKVIPDNQPTIKTWREGTWVNDSYREFIYDPEISAQLDDNQGRVVAYRQLDTDDGNNDVVLIDACESDKKNDYTPLYFNGSGEASVINKIEKLYNWGDVHVQAIIDNAGTSDKLRNTLQKLPDQVPANCNEPINIENEGSVVKGLPSIEIGFEFKTSPSGIVLLDDTFFANTAGTYPESIVAQLVNVEKDEVVDAVEIPLSRDALADGFKFTDGWKYGSSLLKLGDLYEVAMYHGTDNYYTFDYYGPQGDALKQFEYLTPTSLVDNVPFVDRSTNMKCNDYNPGTLDKFDPCSIFAGEDFLDALAAAKSAGADPGQAFTNRVGLTNIGEPTCESKNPGLGWILCSVMRTFVNFLDNLTVDEDGTGFLGNILTFEIKGHQADLLKPIWNGFKTLANLLFVIAFLVIVYSAASGNILSAYDVKKSLPRLVIAAIGVQLSFFITLELLDISNDLGFGAANLLLAPLPGSENASATASAILANSSLSGLASVALGVTYLVLTIIVAFFSILGIMMMALVFILRNMGILILIILSPFAFVAWVLPNTDRYFKKWFEWYIQLLMVFPIAALFFASGKLIAAIWVSSGESINGTNAGRYLIATFALFAPYFVAPKIVSFAGGALKSIAGGVNNMKDKVAKTEMAGRTKERIKSGAFGTLNKAGSYEGDSKLLKSLSKPVGLLGNRKFIGRRAARASEAVRKFDNEDTSAYEVNLGNRAASIRAKEAARLRELGLDDEEIQKGADNKAVEFLDSKMDSNAPDAQIRAAANILGVQFSSNTNAVGALRRVVRDEGRLSSDHRKQNLAAQIIKDNPGIYSQQLIHLLKGDAMVEAGPEAALALTSGAVADIVENADVKYVMKLSEDYADAASNPQQRGQIDLTKVAKVYKGMKKRGLDTSELEAVFEIHEIPLLKPDGTPVKTHDGKDKKDVTARIKASVIGAGSAAPPTGGAGATPGPGSATTPGTP